MRAPRRPVVTVLWLVAFAAAPRGAAAQEKLPAAGAPAATQPAPQTAPAEAAREFAAQPAAVRAAFLTLLQTEAFPLTTEPSETEIVTDFTFFAANRFGRSVATPPPKVSPTFPFYQANRMSTGKARLQATIEPCETGSRVRVEASLLSPAVNRLTFESTEIPRESNGTIEKYFLDQLEALLSAGEPQTAPEH